MLSALTIAPAAGSRAFIALASAPCSRAVSRRGTQPRRELSGNPLRRMPVPQLGHPPALATGAQDLLDALDGARTVATDDGVRALLHRNRPLGVLAHREARNG